MIEFTDATLRESNGYCEETKALMKEDGDLPEWMIRSTAYVSTPFISANYTLHFWKDGRVVIFETDRPIQMETIDEDIRELSLWCQRAGWDKLVIDDRLLVDRHSYEFWKRSFIAGLVVSEQLQQREEEEMDRLSKAYIKEKKEEKEEENDT